MSNLRKDIRMEMALLLSSKTAADDRVYPYRVRHIEDQELPCISVRTASEQVEVFTEAPRQYKRSLDVVIECYHKEDITGVEDLMDDLVSEVEDCFDDEDLFTLSNVISEIYYEGSSIEKQGGEAIKETAYAALRYTVVYYTWAGARVVGADDYSEIDANFGDKAATRFEVEQP